MDSPDETISKTEVPYTKPKRHKKAALDEAGEGETRSLSRIIIRITGFRVNPLDPDNFAGSCKDIIDGLKHAGLLHDDSWDKVKFEPDQRKVSNYSKERTEVEIIYP